METGSEQKKRMSSVREAHKAVKKKMFGYIAAGLGLVAGLAWNDAIKILIDYFIPNGGSTIVAKLLYAVVVTIIVAVVLFSIEKSLSED